MIYTDESESTDDQNAKYNMLQFRYSDTIESSRLTVPNEANDQQARHAVLYK